VDEKVEAALLLETNNGFDLLLDELVVLLGGDLAFAQLGTSLANLLGLRERADGSRGELGQVEVLGLDLLANCEGALALELVGCDGSNTLADTIIRGALEFATLRNGDLVLLEGGGDSSILRAREGGSNGRNLGTLLKGEREPIFLLSGELLLRGEGDGGVEDGRRSGNDNTVSAKGGYCLLAEFDRGGEVGLPDVTSRNKAEGEDNAGGLDGARTSSS